jgi:hypothetical protein
MRQGDRHDRHDHEYCQKRAAQKSRPPDQILHVLGRSLETEAEGGGQDAQLKGPGDEVLKHGSSLRNATSLGSAGTDRAAQRSEHQSRPRDIIPMITRLAAHPLVPRGFRRAVPSSSDAKVLARSLAAEASSDPVTPLVPLPTCEATVWLCCERFLPSRRRPVTQATRMYPSGLRRPAQIAHFCAQAIGRDMVRFNATGSGAGDLSRLSGWNSCALSFIGVQNFINLLSRLS